MSQFNEQFTKATAQFADVAANVNRLALENAEKAFGLHFSAIEENVNATFAYVGELIGVRDAEGLKAVWPKGIQVARTNAERSARVLVGDIELYFPAKVVQGKAQKKLYALLRDELERSRASFTERYGADLEENYNIFHKTVIQQLCEGDPTLLGPVPWSTKG